MIKANLLINTGLLLIMSWFLIACQDTALNTVSTLEPPSLPSSLQNLPRNAEMRCENQPEYNQNPLSLWQYAARAPRDTSNSNPDRGNKTGSVLFCQEITVLDYEWSAFDEEFWLLIETNEGDKGWVSGKYVELDN